MQKIADSFINIGGKFITPAVDIAEKLKNIKAFLFDWDGVFNNAEKSTGHPNGFSEGDSMGINLLRFSHYFSTNNLPLSAIITGEENPTAFDFARRENFTAIYFKIKDKNEALAHLCHTYKIAPENIAWFFDDVLDLGMAGQCGLRFYLARPSQPLTNEFVFDNGLVDYIPAHTGGNNALRECCELLMGLGGNFDKIIQNRMDFSPAYADYFTHRQEVKPLVFTKQGAVINEVFL